MTLRQQRRAEASFRKRMSAQMERDRNGAPPPADLAARMTKPKAPDAAYQVFVDIAGEDGSRPISPKFMGEVGQEACYRVLETVNAQICLGKFKGWGNARIERAAYVPTV